MIVFIMTKRANASGLAGTWLYGLNLKFNSWVIIMPKGVYLALGFAKFKVGL